MTSCAPSTQSSRPTPHRRDAGLRTSPTRSPHPIFQHRGGARAALHVRLPQRRPWPALVWLGLLALLLAGCGAATAARPGGKTPAIASGDRAKLTYVAIGASDAFGVGTDDPASESWPTQLAAELGPSVHLINLGIPGEQVADALANELPVAVDERPDVVTVWLGVNDLVAGATLDEYAPQLETLLSTLRQRTHARIAVGNLPNLTLLPAFYGQDASALDAEVRQWNAAIAAVCQRQDVTLVDLYSGWAELANHPEYIASDGFHPSVAGARRLADLFAAALRQ